MERRLISSGSPWETVVGYSRAVRVGNMVFVSGTTGTDAQGIPVDPSDAYLQAKAALAKIEVALSQAGATFSDVVRTTMYVTDIRHWEEVARAHAECFATVRPAASMVEVSRLIGEHILVEIAVDAVVEVG
jgi:enamine deaminase RidA (YjgF/YER057c/UK114 family)